MDVNITINKNISKHGCPQVKIQTGKRTTFADLDINTLKKSLGDLDELSLDFLLISTCIYIIDKFIPRAESSDGWTRDFDVKIPVKNLAKWNSVKANLSECISFLTGDAWNISFKKLTSSLDNTDKNLKLNLIGIPDVVCLFSGGVDSLAGAIDILETKKAARICLVSHYDGHVKGPRADQLTLLDDLKKTYGNRIDHVQLRAGQHPKGSETTFRSRSVLFLALASVVSSSREGAPVIIPENGTIALNIPLTPSRRGSCSTRTAHPLYLKKLEEILSLIGLDHGISNPYKFHTKGEVVSKCKNLSLLKNIVAKTCSCAKRGHKRTWINRDAIGCGRCMPCIYRRASLHKAKIDKEIYGRDICTGEVDVLAPGELQNDLRAFFSFCSKDYSKTDIERILMANGSLPIDDLSEYASTIIRAFDEIRSWIRDKANDEIKSLANI